MEGAESQDGATGVTGTGYSVSEERLEILVVGDAARPTFGDVNGLVVLCGCDPENLGVRLRDMRVYICPLCQTILARCGNRIIAAKWE